MPSKAGDELRATVCTKVIAMLTRPDAEAVAEAMAAKPIVERTLVREQKVPFSISIALVIVGGVLAVLVMQLLPSSERCEFETEEDTGSEDDDVSSEEGDI